MFFTLNKAIRKTHYSIMDEYVLFFSAWIKPFREEMKKVVTMGIHYQKLTIKNSLQMQKNKYFKQYILNMSI